MVLTIRIFFVALIVFFCFLFYPYLNPRYIGHFITNSGAYAPALFIGVCALRPVLFFLPSLGLTIVAGVLFGSLWGTVYLILGGALSTVVGFYFAKWLGTDLVAALVRKSPLLRGIEKTAKAGGWKAVFYMRLFNLPWDLVSYWAGLSGVGFKDFYIASLLPLAPISYLYAYFGSRVFAPTSPGFIISLALMIMMGAVPYIMGRLERK
jgi:uncharacterized membrane protein YdjX (TVP38/TMEM64 family)